MLHRYLSEEAYWSPGRSRETVACVVAHSLCLGLYAPGGSLIGFARAMTDYAVRAHLGDVFVLPAWRGRGLGQALVAAILEHPDLAGVPVWSLTTRDAHQLYARFGFTVHPEPETQMIRRHRRDD